MQFNQLLERLRGGDEHPDIPTTWQQGRAAFGGLVAAMLYERMSTHVAQDASLRSLTISFVAPAEPGTVETHTDILRAGRSVTQVEGRLRQGDSVVVAALASFGTPRESSIEVASEQAPAMAAPENALELPYIEGLVPEFTQHFDYRIAEGDLPFTGSSNNKFGGWVRFRQPDDASGAQVTISHLLALIDAWPPAVLPMLKQPAPASSLTWTVEFIEPLPAQTDRCWWQYLADVEQASDGYGVVQAKLWSAEGHLVAYTRQTVTVFG